MAYPVIIQKTTDKKPLQLFSSLLIYGSLLNRRLLNVRL